VSRQWLTSGSESLGLWLWVGRCGFGLCADAVGAGGELLRLGSPAGLLADLGQSLKRLRYERVVRSEDLLTNRQRPTVEGCRAGTLDILGCALYSLPDG